MHIVRFTSIFLKFKYIFPHVHAAWGHKHFDLLTINDIKRWVSLPENPVLN